MKTIEQKWTYEQISDKENKIFLEWYNLVLKEAGWTDDEYMSALLSKMDKDQYDARNRRQNQLTLKEAKELGIVKFVFLIQVRRSLMCQSGMLYCN